MSRLLIPKSTSTAIAERAHQNEHNSENILSTVGRYLAFAVNGFCGGAAKVIAGWFVRVLKQKVGGGLSHSCPQDFGVSGFGFRVKIFTFKCCSRIV